MTRVDAASVCGGQTTWYHFMIGENANMPAARNEAIRCIAVPKRLAEKQSSRAQKKEEKKNPRKVKTVEEPSGGSPSRGKIL